MAVLSFIGGLTIVGLLLIGAWWVINNVGVKDQNKNNDDEV